MKKFLAVNLLFSIISLAALAGEQKVCFGVGDAKGSMFVAAFTPTTTVVTASRDSGNASALDKGTYQANGSVQGRDGKTYVSYHISDADGSTDLLVDVSLLQSTGQGYVKSRWRGESFAQSTFFCRSN